MDNHLKILILAIAWSLILSSSFAIASSHGAKRVLLIVGDDAGFETGAYNHSVCKTPYLDKLAIQSAVFTQAFTSVSSCSPSRSALLTGLPVHQNGMYGLHQDVHHFNSLDKVQSIPLILKSKSIKSGIIGKKHVGPAASYSFDYEQTEENNSILQVGRNITKIKLLVRDFLDLLKRRSFFLYVALHDPHRCAHSNPNYGQFCEKFGNGEPGMGLIPDWKPSIYDPDQVQVPYFVPDTPAARRDIAAQYTTISRLDQGIGLLMEELRRVNLLESTLIVYTSDNGIPFPSGRTNLYDPGFRVPLMIKSPLHKLNNSRVITSLVSLLDITPTILDWFNITPPIYNILKKSQPTVLYGTSLVPRMNGCDSSADAVFGSHNFHEITMSYPSRAVRTKRYKLIHNLNSRSSFPIDQDFYLSLTFQDMLNRTVSQLPLHWYKANLKEYYFRDEWELFDLKKDPRELFSVAHKKAYREVFRKLKHKLETWRRQTYDPWLCFPHGVLYDVGKYTSHPRCLPLHSMKEDL